MAPSVIDAAHVGGSTRTGRPFEPVLPTAIVATGTSSVPTLHQSASVRRAVH